MRGAAVLYYIYFVRNGIIPARAGSRTRTATPSCPTRDHPRACGEQLAGGIAALTRLGSSPRVRGAGQGAKAPRHLLGIIPARAGSRRSAVTSATSSRDHPRACGEQGLSLPRIARQKGSSPRVWGAADGRLVRSVIGGIIPARAGSRTRRSRSEPR